MRVNKISIPNSYVDLSSGRVGQITGYLTSSLMKLNAIKQCVVLLGGIRKGPSYDLTCEDHQNVSKRYQSSFLGGIDRYQAIIIDPMFDMRIVLLD